MPDFGSQVADFVVKVQNQSIVGCKAVAMTIGRRIIMRTPVDKGRARGNWQGGVGSIPTGEGSEDITGATSIENIQSAVNGWNPATGESLFIANNLRYIYVLEYGLYPNPPKHGTGKTINGFSTQAPAGMVGLTVAEFDGIVQSSFATYAGKNWDIGSAGE